ncbi:BTB domain-containing protein [Mycena indigotica]|uniref:BTB domain-containing protein n=1 Tax=Mycena indigotica TaxID=2126181 RepID=A0A8H6TCH4_9AGAR|nr:BTB domain-containing protein [Mycena indigotica]KAF7314940.1 BTB domain-containing protein [Mycena indigotica]
MNAPNDGYTRIPALWFQDGNIVIRTQNTLCKVHCSILSLRSGVFQDMLAFPQATGGVETMDECPLVDLTDEPDDGPSKKVDLLPLLGILRLSHKYDVEKLHRRALEHFDHGMFYSSYHAFLKTPDSDLGPLAQQHTITVPDSIPAIASSSPCIRVIPTLSNSPIALLLAIKAITSVQAQCLLPVAYYWLCIMPIQDLLAVPEDILPRAKLHWILQKRKVLAVKRAKILENINQFGWKADCEQVEQCASARMELLSHHIRQNARGDDVCLLHAVTVVDFGRQAGLCASCLKGVNALCSEAFHWEWATLPALFDLPDWEVLNQDRINVLDLFDDDDW